MKRYLTFKMLCSPESFASKRIRSQDDDYSAYWCILLPVTKWDPSTSRSKSFSVHRKDKAAGSTSLSNEKG